MKKYAFLATLSLILTACSNSNVQHHTAASQKTQPQGIPYTKEQYEKLAEAINKNKHSIINQMNKELEQLKGTTIQAPAE